MKITTSREESPELGDCGSEEPYSSIFATQEVMIKISNNSRWWPWDSLLNTYWPVAQVRVASELGNWRMRTLPVHCIHEAGKHDITEMKSG